MRSILTVWIRFFTFGICVLWASTGITAERTVDLVVGYKSVNFANKTIQAMALNNQLPGPILHFKEGDRVTINVHNRLNEGTALHWHGVLVPWQMDGVAHVTQEPIPPGGSFRYQFTLKQSGTYWYHAHAGLQEQQGVYGAFIIDPPRPAQYKYTKDFPVVLSDWSNTDPKQIYANLKKDGDYYSPNFPMQPSLTRFTNEYRKGTPAERKKLMDDYHMMQYMRMSIFDISDVAYDAFLMNGHPPTRPWTQRVNVGDVVRLRFIGAGGSTLFRVKIPGSSMQLVHVQGNDVQPYFVDDLTIAPGETYDVLVKIKTKSPTIIYAESADKVGAVYGALVTNHQPVDYKSIVPFPDPKPVSMGSNMAGMTGMAGMEKMQSMQGMEKMQDGMMMPPDPKPVSMGSNMAGMTGMAGMEKMQGMQGMEKMQGGMMPPDPKPVSMGSNMAGMEKMQSMQGMEKMQGAESMDMSSQGSSMSSVSPTSSTTKYTPLKAVQKTNDPAKPVQIIKMKLSGFMGRYEWFLNDVPEYQAKPISIEPGKRYRVIFINDSMMNHPMHIHGHWFILRNGQGAYDPLLHTINVPPGATIVADFDANAESGRWYFHCHNLFHMKAGMATQLYYPDQQKRSQSHGTDANTPYPTAHPAGIYRASFLEVSHDFNRLTEISFKALIGSDHNKLQLYTQDAEINKGKVENADLDVFYWRPISEFWAIKGGANYVYRPAQTPYWQPGIGIEGLMPYFIDTNVRAYFHQGSTKLDIQLSRDSQIGNNFFIRTGIRSILATATVAENEIGQGLNQMQFILRPYLRIRPGISLYTEFKHKQNYGALKNIRQRLGESTSETTLSLGLSLTF
jgi:CopA family copper-resistance protein